MKKSMVAKYLLGTLLLCVVASFTSCGPVYYQNQTYKKESISKYDNKKDYRTSVKEVKKSEKQAKKSEKRR
ncbi:MAG: hypothetical protein R3Y39_03605 [Rikenellaceae bacterium]